MKSGDIITFGYKANILFKHGVYTIPDRYENKGKRFSMSFRYIKEVKKDHVFRAKFPDFIYGYHVDKVIELDPMFIRVDEKLTKYGDIRVDCPFEFWL